MSLLFVENPSMLIEVVFIAAGLEKGLFEVISGEFNKIIK
jgi:hypothetical protein